MMANTMSDFRHAVLSAIRAEIAGGRLKAEPPLGSPELDGAVVTFRTERILVRFVRERGQVFVELACPASPEDWHLLQRAMKAVGAADVPAEGPLSIEEAAELLGRHCEMLDA